MLLWFSLLLYANEKYGIELKIKITDLNNKNSL